MSREDEDSSPINILIPLIIYKILAKNQVIIHLN